MQRLHSRETLILIWQIENNYSSKTNELAFFRARLKPEISKQLLLLLQQHATQNYNMNLESVHKNALLAEQIISKISNFPKSAVMQPTTSKATNCFTVTKRVITSKIVPRGRTTGNLVKITSTQEKRSFLLTTSGITPKERPND